MYGSYPEMTITARYQKPLMERFRFFNTDAHQRLVPLEAEEILGVARDIHSRNEERRRERASS